MTRVGVIGASGYVGGELVRLLLGHPAVEVTGLASRSHAGRRVDGVHPNLRGITSLTFRDPDDMDDCDVVFLATPHGQTVDLAVEWAGRAACVIDLSADFRLRDPEVFEHYYGVPHAAPEMLPEFVMGWPERERAAIAGAKRISVPGCTATAAILGLYPLAAAGLLAAAIVDARVGSSGSGSRATAANLHAERSGAMRVFAPTGHRHEAEIMQALGCPVTMSATAVEAVRGVQVLCHATPSGDLDPDERELRRLYRERYLDEPFVRIVAHRRGRYRLPEPKILSGSNFCDVGFARGHGGGIVVVAALDNLMKGGAGNAVQCLNIRLGLPERTGLEFPGLHPI